MNRYDGARVLLNGFHLIRQQLRLSLASATAAFFAAFTENA